MIEDLSRHNPAAWQRNGLITVSLQRPVRQKLERRTSRPLVPAFMLSLSFIAFTSYSLSSVTINHTSDVGRIETQIDMFCGQALPSNGGDGISSSTWVGLMNALKTYPQSKETDGPEPEPFF